MPDLSTPETTREFLVLCLDPPARESRTPTKLARVMPEWLRTALHGHAPHLAPLHIKANRLKNAATRAQDAYVKAMKVWIDGDDTAPTADGLDEDGSPYVAALRATADRYDEILARTPNKEADPRYYAGVRDMIHGLRNLADEAQQQAEGDSTEPTQLRWGLNDVMWGDDATVTVLLSGPAGEPYWLELDPDRAAALRLDLAGPPEEKTPLPPIGLVDVEGFCPACGHGVLMLGEGGHVVCTLMDCPNPNAADELLRGVTTSPIS